MSLSNENQNQNEDVNESAPISQPQSQDDEDQTNVPRHPTKCFRKFVRNELSDLKTIISYKQFCERFCKQFDLDYPMRLYIKERISIRFTPKIDRLETETRIYLSHLGSMVHGEAIDRIEMIVPRYHDKSEITTSPSLGASFGFHQVRLCIGVRVLSIEEG